MNIQGQQHFNTRWLQIGLLAVLAVALMVAAAFWFGTGLRADTAQSVAPSPLGSSLTAVRLSQSVARSPLGSSLTNVRESISPDYVERLRNSGAAARSASPAVLPEGSSDFSIYLRGSPAAAPSAGLSAADYAAKHGIPAASR